MPRLIDYQPIVGEGVVKELTLLGERLAGKRVLNVNSTRLGGGVAEILQRLVPLLNEVGLNVRWETIRGSEEFFVLTKNLHNALQGKSHKFTERDREVFEETTAESLRTLNLDADIIFIQDPQPSGLIAARKKVGGRW